MAGAVEMANTSAPKRMTNDGANLLTIGTETNNSVAAETTNNSKKDDKDANLTDFQKKVKRARLTAEKFGEHGIFSSVMSVITIYTLYQADIRLAATGKEADDGFLIVASIIFFIFLFEILLQSFYKDGYCFIPKWAPEPGETLTETWWRRLQVGSFYFWLDWIATLTLIFDVSHSLVRSFFLCYR
jgi:hypothetical protein